MMEQFAGLAQLKAVIGKLAKQQRPKQKKYKNMQSVFNKAAYYRIVMNLVLVATRPYPAEKQTPEIVIFRIPVLFIINLNCMSQIIYYFS